MTFWFIFGALSIFYGVLLVSLLRLLKALRTTLLDTKGRYVIGFEDSPQGRMSYKMWNYLSIRERRELIPVEEDKTVCLLPGMTLTKVGGISFDKHIRVEENFEEPTL